MDSDIPDMTRCIFRSAQTGRYRGDFGSRHRDRRYCQQGKKAFVVMRDRYEMDILAFGRSNGGGGDELIESYKVCHQK